MLNHDEQDKILALAKQIAETYNPFSNTVWIITKDITNTIIMVFKSEAGAKKWCSESNWHYQDKHHSDKFGKNVTITRYKVHGK
jgi:hypothetical protein